MPVGRPDWYPVGQSESIASVMDVGELAARLGSGVNFDRSGKVMYADDFTRLDGLYTHGGSGVTTAFAAQTVIAETGGSAISTVIAAGATNYNQIKKKTRLWDSNIAGFESAIYSTLNSPEMYFDFSVLVQDGNYRASIKISSVAPRLEYLDENNLYVTLANTEVFNFAQDYFIALKLDVNVADKKYKQFRINQLSYDMSDIPLRRVGAASYYYYEPLIKIFGLAALPMTVYIDRFIVTEDE